MFFSPSNQVASHVYQTHLQHLDNPPTMESMFHKGTTDSRSHTQQGTTRRCCRWRGCQTASMARACFSLMTHVLDWHCAVGELEKRRLFCEQLLLHDNNMLAQGLNNKPSSGDSSFGEQTAWSVMRTMEMRQVQMDLWTAHHHYVSANPHNRHHVPLPSVPMSVQQFATPPPREGPVTKHLRVTAALVLRNLVTHLQDARKYVFLVPVVLVVGFAFNGIPTTTFASIPSVLARTTVRRFLLPGGLGRYLVRFW